MGHPNAPWTVTRMANATLMARAPALQATQVMHVRTSAQISALAKDTVWMGHVSALQVGQVWIAQLKSAVVGMEIVVFQTLVSVIKAGWAHSVRWRWYAQTPNAAIMVIVNLERAIAREAGQETFVINHPLNVGLVLQVPSVIAPLVCVCVACHPVHQIRAKAKARVRAVVRAKERRNRRMVVSRLQLVIYPAKPMQKQRRKKVQTPKMLIWRGTATHPMVTGTQRWTSATVTASGTASTAS